MDPHKYRLGQMVEQIVEYSVVEAVAVVPDDEHGYFVIGPLLSPIGWTTPITLDMARHLAQTANEVPR